MGALTVVGLCKSSVAIDDRSMVTDENRHAVQWRGRTIQRMRLCLLVQTGSLIDLFRLANSWKQYRRMRGRTLVSACA